jgi:hypothetical protein
MKQSVDIIPTGSLLDVLTPPAGHKFEVLHISVSEYTGIAKEFRIALNHTMVVALWLDVLKIAAGDLVNERSYEAIVIPDDSALTMGAVAAAAGFGVAVTTYIDVDLA